MGRHGASAQQISIFLRPIRERANLVTDLVEGLKGGGFIPLQKGKVRKIESRLRRAAARVTLSCYLSGISGTFEMLR